MYWRPRSENGKSTHSWRELGRTSSWLLLQSQGLHGEQLGGETARRECSDKYQVGPTPFFALKSTYGPTCGVLLIFTMSTHVYLGPWVNWAHGPILGATITLSQRSGGLLISFVATFVTIVGAQLWRILSFIIHQFRATKDSQDGLHYQQQNIFRNTSSPGGAAWSFLQQLWYWPGKAGSVFLRTVPWILFSVLYIGLFGLLATFSAEVSKATGELRRIEGGDCGYWTVDQADPTSPDALQAFNQKMANDSLVAATYARACYGGTPAKLQCGSFPVGHIPYTTEQNATCPFESGMCVYGDTAAFRLTTGKIDSQADLGINMPKSQRVQLIKDTTCAPLIQSRQTVNGTSSPGGFGVTGDTIMQYHYGTIGEPDTGDFMNYTWMYNTHAHLDQLPYSTWSVQSSAPHTNLAGWNPSSNLIRTDADLSLIFIAGNSMQFMQQCDDPVFGAHVEHRGTAYLSYMPDEWAVPISCSERYKICNPNNVQCTPWNGIMGLYNSSRHIGLSQIQANETARVILAAQVSAVYYQTFTRGGAALRALELASGLVQQSLPCNQWEIEVSSWFDAGLSRIQHIIQEYATGPTNIIKGSALQRPSDLQDATSQRMCDNQLIKDPGDSTSFSIIGLVVVFVVGGFIIVTSLALDPIVGWSQERFHVGEHKKLSWQLDDKLQQQRMLLGGVGLGAWEGARGFPTTVKPQTFGGYESIDIQHPTMRGSPPQIADPSSWIRSPSTRAPSQHGAKSAEVFVTEVP